MKGEADVTPNEQATKLVDNAIKQISGRDLVSTSEMTDLLLDIRLYLIQQESYYLIQQESYSKNES
jgi:hypothetical protein